MPPCVVSFSNFVSLSGQPLPAHARAPTPPADMPSSLDPAAQQTLEQRSAEVSAESATVWSLACLRGHRANPPDGLQYDKRNRAPITKALRKYSELLYKSPRLGYLPVLVIFAQNVARWNGISHRLILGTAVTPPLRKGRGARALPLCLGSAAIRSERNSGPAGLQVGVVLGYRLFCG